MHKNKFPCQDNASGLLANTSISCGYSSGAAPTDISAGDDAATRASGVAIADARDNYVVLVLCVLYKLHYF